uniref:ATP-dependent RNA helicase ROK1 n=1 Tax=Lygus hesperus TaxID=30085 RepID=A0A0A9XIY5_LYGHE
MHTADSGGTEWDSYPHAVPEYTAVIRRRTAVVLNTSSIHKLTAGPVHPHLLHRSCEQPAAACNGTRIPDGLVQIQWRKFDHLPIDRLPPAHTNSACSSDKQSGALPTDEVDSV